MIVLFNNDSVIADRCCYQINVGQQRHAKTNEAYNISNLSLLQYTHTKSNDCTRQKTNAGLISYRHRV